MAQVKLKKPKISNAKPLVSLSKKAPTHSANGGTTAPPRTSVTHATGIGNNTEYNTNHPGSTFVPKSKPAGGNAGSPSNGAAPSSGSSPPPPTAAPLTQASLEGRVNADTKLHEAERADTLKKYQAALAYGDQAMISYWGQKAAEAGNAGLAIPTGPVNGTVQRLQKEYETGQHENVLKHTGNNTFRSGFNLNDIQGITDASNTAKENALAELNNAINELAEAETAAREKHNEEYREFSEEDIAEDLAPEPEPEDNGQDSSEPEETQQESTGFKKKYPSKSKKSKTGISMGKKAK